MKARDLTLKTSLNYSIISTLVIFSILAIYLMRANIQFVEEDFAQSLKEDNELISQSIRIGDIFTLEKYASSKVKSGKFLVFGVKDLGSEEIIFQVGDEDLLKSKSNYTLKQGSLLIPLFSVFKDQWGKEWEGFAVGHLPLWVLLEPLLISLIICIIVFSVLVNLLKTIAHKFSLPIEAAALDFERNDLGDRNIIKTPQYDQSLKIDEVDILVTTTKNLMGKIFSQNEKLKKMEVLEALRLQSKQVDHDLRSPLGALKAASQSKKGDPELINNVINKSILRIESILEDLKDQSAAPSPVSKSFDFVAIISDLKNEKLLEYQGLGLAINLEVTDSKQLVVGDKIEFLRVFSNLINNAVEACDDEPTITISSRIFEDRLQVSFADCGSGIDQADLDKVTEYGFTKGKESGSGTGLWHAKKTIEAYGGSIDIKSEVGKGTTIELWFVKA